MHLWPLLKWLIEQINKEAGKPAFFLDKIYADICLINSLY